jgi:Helix-turn-helix domain
MITRARLDDLRAALDDGAVRHVQLLLDDVLDDGAGRHVHAVLDGRIRSFQAPGIARSAEATRQQADNRNAPRTRAGVNPTRHRVIAAASTAGRPRRHHHRRRRPQHQLGMSTDISFGMSSRSVVLRQLGIPNFGALNRRTARDSRSKINKSPRCKCAGFGRLSIPRISLGREDSRGNALLKLVVSAFAVNLPSRKVVDDMSISAIRWAIDQEISDPSVKLTLILLANCMNSETGKCCPSLRHLAKKGGQSQRTVQRHLRQLMAESLISVTPASDSSGRQRSNDYSLNLKGTSKSARREGVDSNDGVSRASRMEGVAGAGGAGSGGASPDVDEGVTDAVDVGDTGDTPYMNQKEEPEEIIRRKKERARADTGDTPYMNQKEEPEEIIRRKKERARADDIPDRFIVSPAQSEADISAKPDSTNGSQSPAERESAPKTPVPEESHGRAAGRRGRHGPAPIPIPADLELSAGMLAFADERGWDCVRCEHEFELFKAYYGGNGDLAVDWGARWRSWVLRGLKFDEKERREARGRTTGATMADTLLAHAAAVARQGGVQ